MTSNFAGNDIIAELEGNIRALEGQRRGLIFFTQVQQSELIAPAREKVKRYEVLRDEAEKKAKFRVELHKLLGDVNQVVDDIVTTVKPAFSVVRQQQNQLTTVFLNESEQVLTSLRLESHKIETQNRSIPGLRELYRVRKEVRLAEEVFRAETDRTLALDKQLQEINKRALDVDCAFHVEMLKLREEQLQRNEEIEAIDAQIKKDNEKGVAMAAKTLALQIRLKAQEDAKKVSLFAGPSSGGGRNCTSAKQQSIGPAVQPQSVAAAAEQRGSHADSLADKTPVDRRRYDGVDAPAAVKQPTVQRATPTVVPKSGDMNAVNDIATRSYVASSSRLPFCSNDMRINEVANKPLVDKSIQAPGPGLEIGGVSDVQMHSDHNLNDSLGNFSISDDFMSANRFDSPIGRFDTDEELRDLSINNEDEQGSLNLPNAFMNLFGPGADDNNAKNGHDFFQQNAMDFDQGTANEDFFSVNKTSTNDNEPFF